MVEAIQEAKKKTGKVGSGISPLRPIPWPLAEGLLASGCVRFGDFRLKSGERSPIYFDLRRLASHPDLLGQAAGAYLPLLGRVEWQVLAAVPLAGLPIGTALALQTGRPMVYPRPERKDHGTSSQVEGVFTAGQRAVLIDDVITTGGSKIEAAGVLRATGLVVEDVVVLIDRQAGGGQELAQAGMRLHAVFTLKELLEHWWRTGKIEAAVVSRVTGTASPAPTTSHPEE